MGTGEGAGERKPDQNDGAHKNDHIQNQAIRRTRPVGPNRSVRENESDVRKRWGRREEGRGRTEPDRARCAHKQQESFDP
jgi:hypothetical protein